MPPSRAHRADAVAHGYAVEAARAGDGAVVHRENHAVTLLQRYHLDAGLHAWTLLREHQLAALEIASGLGEEHSDLQREDVLAAEILVQAVVVAGAIAQQQRRRAGLSRGMAAGDEVGVLCRIAHLDTHRLVPAVGDRRQARIEGSPQVGDDTGQRIAEVLVLAAAEAVPRHHDAAPEGSLGVVETGHGLTARAIEQARQHGPTLRVEVGRDREPGDPLSEVETGERPLDLESRPAAQATASRASRARLRSLPQR